MLTRLGKNATQMYSVDGTNQYVGSAEVKNTLGNTVYLRNGKILNESMTTLSTSASSAGICFGSGNTPASEEDYMLESIITTLSATFSITRALNSSNFPTITINIILNNTGANTVTVNEIGLIQSMTFATQQGGTTAPSSGERYGLVWRDVLNNGVEIEAGESKTFVLNFAMSGLELVSDGE